MFLIKFNLLNGGTKDMQLALGIITVLAALIGLITAYIKYKEVKVKKETGDSKGNVDNGNGDSISTGDSSDGNISVISGGGNVTINKNQTTTENEEKKSNVQEHNNKTGIVLSDIYTSLFAEDNRLKTEQIRITKQTGSDIEGKVVLHEGRNLTLTYDLRGTFSNRILTAEYYSSEHSNDERGSINLKLITNNIFSGFCSFSKSSVSTDDEIRVSPYIWHAGENVDLLNGTYEFCTECYNEHAVCCCASEEIDMPIFLDTEKSNITATLPRRKRRTLKFYNPLPAPFDQSSVWQMHRIEKNTACKKETRCTFFEPNEERCNIYASRPLDCRLFPFDIKLAENRAEYIIGYYPDLCERTLPDEREMKKYAHILRPYFFLLYPYLHIITSDVACERLKNAEFKKIANFKEFVF